MQETEDRQNMNENENEVRLDKPKINKKKLIVVSVCVLVAVIAAVIVIVMLTGKDSYRSIRVVEVEGGVMTANGNKEYLAYPNMLIGGGMALSTEEKSFARMTLDDNKYVRLDEESRAVFSELSSDPKRTVIEVTEGALISEIVTPLENNEAYVINTPNVVMAVRGTIFRAEVCKDENGTLHTYVYTFGGEVSCKKNHGESELSVPSGHMADIYDSGASAEAETKEITLDILEDTDLIDIYRASENGHEVFASSEEIRKELEARGMEIFTYELEGTCNPSYADDKGGGIYEAKAGGIAGENVYRAALRADSCGEKFSVDIDGNGINISPEYVEISGTLFLSDGKFFDMTASGRARADGSGTEAEVFCGECSMIRVIDSKNSEEKKYRIVSAEFRSGALKVNTPSDMRVKIIVTSVDG